MRFFNIHSVAKPKKKKGALWWKKIRKSRKITERGNPLVSAGIVCYAEKRKNFFGSVPQPNRYILASSQNFVELLVELFRSLQVYRKKTLTKSHD